MPIAATAVMWMIFMIVVFLSPATPTPTSANMNYTVVVWGKSCRSCRSNTIYLTFRHVGGSLVGALAYYCFPVYGGVHWFKGPVQTVQLADVSSQGSHSEAKEDIISDKRLCSEEN